MKQSIILSLVLINFTTPSNAQDILGGEITYHHLGGRTYEIKASLYSKTSIGDDHTSVKITLGEGNPQMLNAVSSNSVGDVTHWQYSTTHTYSADGVYNIHLPDSFRLANISNIPGSASENITLSAELVIDTAISSNSSPTFLTPPAAGRDVNTYTFTPAALDSDGDSLSYKLVPASATNYTFPAGATIDPINGNFQMPYAPGDYAINLEINEWRNGALLGRIYREMLIGESNYIGLSGHDIDDRALQMFPNPASKYLYVSYEKVIANIEVYDLSGKLIFAKNEISNTNHKLDLENISAGAYIMKIVDADGGSLLKKFQVAPGFH